MPLRTQFQEQLLLNLVRAESRQDLLDQLIIRTLGLRSVTLWWQADGVQTAICRAGSLRSEGEPTPLPSEARYLLSLTTGISLSPEVLAVLGLRLVHLDAQQTIAALNDHRSSLERAARTDALTGAAQPPGLRHRPGRHRRGRRVVCRGVHRPRRVQRPQ